MGSCFSKRNLSDAAVTHNASPRSSFGLSCKSDAANTTIPPRPLKKNDEIVVVLSKDATPVLANSQISHSSNGKQSAYVSATQRGASTEKSEDVKRRSLQRSQDETFGEERDGHSLAGRAVECQISKSSEDQIPLTNSRTQTLDDDKLCSSSEFGLSIDVKGISTPTNADDARAFCTNPERGFEMCDAERSVVEDKEIVVCVDDEFVIEMDPAEDDGVLSSFDSLRQPCSQEALFLSQKTRQCQVDPFKVCEVEVCEVEKESTNPPESEKAFLRAPGSEKMPETLDYGMRSFRACDLERDPMKHPESEKASLRSPGLGRASETPHYGTTKFLEGLDLVDVLPHRLSLSHSDALDDAEEGLKPTLSDSFQHQSNDLTADFFAFKNRYLSSCAVLSQKSVSATGCCPSETHDIKISSASVYSEAQADHGSSSDLHSRASSLDSTEHIGVSTCSSKQYLTGVAKEDENEWVSDESETFEFKQPVRNPPFTTPGAQEGNGTRGQIKGVVTYSSGEMCNLGSSYKGIGSTSVKELSVVATGDALLYTSSNPEEFDLIPSQSPVSTPKERNDVFSDASVANQDFCYSCPKRHSDNDQEKKLNNSLSYDDIILLLEKEELDEDIMISFFNFAKTMQNHGGSSCPASDVASEASFEFRVKSTGSTPHSTPSTPMLSAGSTPKHITQLSPLALTPEEIAEIWGVFEQRQALSPFSRCSYP